MRMTELAEGLRAAFAPAIEREEVELVGGEADRELELVADDWTLHVETSPDVAWLAIDLEPESAAEATASLREALPPAAIQALATVDRRLDGALSAALTASGDPLSVTLAAELATAGDTNA